jgi:hypothetical protein
LLLGGRAAGLTLVLPIAAAAAFPAATADLLIVVG